MVTLIATNKLSTSALRAREQSQALFLVRCVFGGGGPRCRITHGPKGSYHVGTASSPKEAWIIFAREKFWGGLKEVERVIFPAFYLQLSIIFLKSTLFEFISTFFINGEKFQKPPRVCNLSSPFQNHKSGNTQVCLFFGQHTSYCVDTNLHGGLFIL